MDIDCPVLLFKSRQIIDLYQSEALHETCSIVMAREGKSCGLKFTLRWQLWMLG